MTDANATPLQPRILHLGFGAFARAHMMVYLQDLRDAGGDWGIIACRLNSGVEGLDALQAAGLEYNVLATDDEGTRTRRITTLAGTLHPARDGIDAVLARIADPGLAIISLTITEKGYALREGKLDRDHRAIRADLADPDHPRSAIGVIVAGLAARRAAGHGGLSVLSCDNLPHNGALARRAVLDFAEMRDADLAAWIDTNVSFPATMIDRIVPALDDAALKLIASTTGRADRESIVTEPFRQWVIQDSFAAGRPDLARAGAQLVPDVAPYEEMKLRMLNGAHSFLACIGQLSGHCTVADCMDDAVLRQTALRLMLDEQAKTLKPLDGIDLGDYARRLIGRFSNSQLHHRTAQIAADSSAKRPQRLVAPAADHIAAGRPWPVTALAIAGWMRLVRLTLSQGDDLPDPMREVLADIVSGTQDGTEFTDAMLQLGQVFPADLAADPRFASPIRDAYQALLQAGPAHTLSNLPEPA
jgi:fructuronate reductase